jgi:hypothetical protein
VGFFLCLVTDEADIGAGGSGIGSGCFDHV